MSSGSSNLILGRYTVHETIAPPGYALDPDTVTVDITTGDTTGDAGTFVDPLLFKLDRDHLQHRHRDPR